ncbi:MAG: DUF4159 domain-containing protein [Dongiaceae bacterium]
MWTIGSFAFASPWILLALAALPVIWWLLRITPPAPQRMRFPAIRLLFDLIPREETPHRTPLWLILFRILLATLLIAALAHPLINPADRFERSGPLLLVVDDGWTSATRWQERLTAMAEVIDRAERSNLPVSILATAPRADGQPTQVSGALAATEARSIALALTPRPWPTDRGGALAALDGLRPDGTMNVVWLSDGVAAPGPGIDDNLVARLQALGDVTVLRDSPEDLPLLLLPPSSSQAGITVTLRRPDGNHLRTVTVRATGENGELVAREEVGFGIGETVVEHKIALPVELRNRMARLAIEGEQSAGATVLLDERWRQRPVGLVSGAPEAEVQPLLGDLYYLERALEPFSVVRRGGIDDLLRGKLAVLVLADVGSLPDAEIAALTDWLEKGGMLVRFAGSRLAQGADALQPVRLRGTDRAVGGAMSWAQPLRLAPFPAHSPFAGLPVPTDVMVRRQVLAEPEIDLGDKTWARLSDGTPLVTASKLKDGWIVLFHTTANADWSNLALSGLFVDMLQRIVALSAGVVEIAEDATLPPLRALDGFGQLAAPPATAIAATTREIDAGKTSPRHPPGYYGHDEARRALNLSPGIEEFAPLPALPSPVTEAGFIPSPEIDLKPWLLAILLWLFAFDMLIGLALRGLLSVRRTVPIAIMLWLAAGGATEAQEANDETAIMATAQTHLAYVRTGVPEVDATSKAGMQGLTFVLGDRTAIDTGPPIGVDVDTDELAFFPLLYWPVSPGQQDLSDAARQRLNAYLRNGGTILFDTLDQDAGRAMNPDVSGPGMDRLRRLVEGLEVPPLVPVPPDHVLTKSFYLMQEFPGRWADGQVWVERGEDRVNDGVSSVIIGGNDWASAWAVDDSGRPMFAVVPGGEHQREMSYRFGVNLMMYALTGNYKSDQVHVPAILERLGQ